MKSHLRYLARLAILVATAFKVMSAGDPVSAAEFFVSPSGGDANAGTKAQPFATLSRAQQAVRQANHHDPVTVWVDAGTYYLPETLIFTAADSGTPEAPVIYQPWAGAHPVISGGQRLNLKWKPYRNGIMKARVPAGLTTDQLFVNGQRQILARFPNFDPNAKVLDGYAADAFSPARAARWADPRGGFIHALQENLWGSLDFRITGKNAKGEVTYEGGWQNNRPSFMHKEYRFVENIFEELDAPGEWFLEGKTGTLYYYPPAGLDLNTASIETVRLRQLVEFAGSAKEPVTFVTLRGFTFHQTRRTFMDTREPLLRSDWTICRSGAIFLNGTEHCSITGCDFDQLGGNTVFVNNYNRQLLIQDCLIKESGANGICFVGDSKAVYSPLLAYARRQGFDQVDQTPGPQTSDYPADCLVDDCLITRIGRFEKQTAGVEISMSRDITVRHCSIYEVPRAGINIGDGCWGGNIIEFCDVFDTVLETGDHGSFNSWGRDRYWGLTNVPANGLSKLARLDAVEPNVLRNSRWRCDHGWDIDLDDGSSNYEISNNLCLNGGIKLREGFFRACENNIMVNNTFHPHVWYGGSQDVFRHNIVFAEYKPIRVSRPWGKECDLNLLYEPGRTPAIPAASLQEQSGADRHSLAADALFINPATGDYRVLDKSPALELGFQNFPMNQFGVVSPRLKILARTPKMPEAGVISANAKAASQTSRSVWQGAVIKDLEGEEYSAVGVVKNTFGVVLADVPGGSEAAQSGLQTGDFIQYINARPVHNVVEFMKIFAALTPARPVQLRLVRNQNAMVTTVTSAALPSVTARSKTDD